MHLEGKKWRKMIRKALCINPRHQGSHVVGPKALSIKKTALDGGFSFF